MSLKEVTRAQCGLYVGVLPFKVQTLYGGGEKYAYYRTLLTNTISHGKFKTFCLGTILSIPVYSHIYTNILSPVPVTQTDQPPDIELYPLRIAAS